MSTYDRAEKRKRYKARKRAAGVKLNKGDRRGQKLRYAERYPEKAAELAADHGRRSYERHREARLAYAKEWRASNPGYTPSWKAKRPPVESGLSRPDRLEGLSPSEIRRDRALMSHYRLTLAEWRAIFEAQGERCAVCGAEDPGVDHGWATDHDHRTGLVRGILCNRCNSALGVLGDTRVGIAIWSSRFLCYLHETAPRTRSIIEAHPAGKRRRRGYGYT